MTLNELRELTRLYTRDTNSYMFTVTAIDTFLNQAIDRLRQIPILSGMSKLKYQDDEVTVLPEQYHYLLALFAASRLFDFDERFYEGVEKRNEFEQLLSDLVSEIESGNLTIYDEDGNEVDNPAVYIEYVKDEYFNKPKDSEFIKDGDEDV
jgi:hypothetical protein